MRIFTRFLVAVLCVIGTGSMTNAQVLTGSIVGQVADTSGAVVPDAAIKITHRETNQVRSAITNASGDFSFPSLPGGTYDVVVSKTGFQTFSAQALTVSAGQVVRVDAALRVGNIS